MARKAESEDEDAHRLDAQLLSDLWIFRTAARLGSITAAAGRLRVTQGAVSQRVIRLEGRLGTTLFSRKNGRLMLTEPGDVLLAAMNEVSIKLNSAVSRFDRVQRSSLVVSCLPSLATEWLVPRLDDFYRDNPEIELFIRAEHSFATSERMEDQKIDVLISYQQAPSSDLTELAQLQELIIPVCSRAYRDAMEAQREIPEIIRLHDDAPYDDVPSRGRSSFEWNAWQAATPAWRDQVIADRHFNLAHLTYHAALCGQGIAMGRAVLVNRLLRRGELIAATSLPPAPGAIYQVLAHRPGAARSPTRRFAAWLITAMEVSQRETLAMLGAGQGRGG